MKKQHPVYQLIRSVLFICAVFLVINASAKNVSAAGLAVDDCIKCHEQQPREIETAGSAHKDKTNCIECHAGHRPTSQKNIPVCSQCHEGSDHYALENCLRCHQNPHEPLNIVLKGELKAECLTCHTEQNAQMVANPSKHAEASCNFCHADKHGVIPACSECHEPHTAEMVQTDCVTCHAVHEPLVLAYPKTTSSKLCVGCHETPSQELLATQTKHRNVGCVACHADKHKNIPECSNCHGLPHPAGMHAKFPKCGDCHGTAHDLNNLKIK
jgi:predicted CXXCH cytochrome family protein